MAAPARYSQHVERLTALIRDGSLVAGSQLMPHRDYADKHGIAVATAARVYRTLIERGLAVGETGRGTFVRSVDTHIAGMFSQTDEADPNTIDLAFNYPVLPEQAAQLRHTLRRLSDRGDLATLLEYHPHPGRREDRRAAASWFSKDGARIEADDLIICGGSQHAISVIIATLAGSSDLIAVESSTYPGFMSAARLAGTPVIGVELDNEGLVPESLDAVCARHAGRVRMVYTMPTVHNPTGVVMPLQRRRALIEVARRRDLLIIDDSVYGYLEPSPPPSLRSLAPERVIEIQSMSKCAAAGLRVGYIIAPQHVRAHLTEGLRATMWSTSAISAALVSAWMSDGTLSAWTNAKRKDARLRQDLARQILGAWSITSHPGSYHLVLDLPGPCRPDDLVLALRQRSVMVTPFSAFAAPNMPMRRAIRVAMAAPPTQERLETGLRIIAGTLESNS
jgi:DNA-binding transcriptional MocR family regulator